MIKEWVDLAKETPNVGKLASRALQLYVQRRRRVRVSLHEERVLDPKQKVEAIIAAARRDAHLGKHTGVNFSDPAIPVIRKRMKNLNPQEQVPVSDQIRVMKKRVAKINWIAEGALTSTGMAMMSNWLDDSVSYIDFFEGILNAFGAVVPPHNIKLDVWTDEGDVQFLIYITEDMGRLIESRFNVASVSELIGNNSAVAGSLPKEVVTLRVLPMLWLTMCNRSLGQDAATLEKWLFLYRYRVGLG